MDWSQCGDVVVSAGAPLVRGTETHADDLIAELLSGMTWREIADKHKEIPETVAESVLRFGAERLAFDQPSLVDWSGCALVERVPGKLAGAPAIVGTRIFADTIAKYYWSGASVDEIEEDYPSLSRTMILQLIQYVKSKEAQAA